MEGKIDTVTRKSLPTKILTENQLAMVGIKVLKNFVDKQLHDKLVNHLSASQWVNSQSGRRKVDFGPKVNFKKQKIKLNENFEGFPIILKPVVDKLVSKLGFLAHEILYLEYNPSKGAHIDPHIDDSWSWGEQIVNLNLKEPTIMTFSDGNIEYPVYLNPSDLLAINGVSRHEWTHEIKQTHIKNLRYCITFRDLSKQVQHQFPSIVNKLENPTPYF